MASIPPTGSRNGVISENQSAEKSAIEKVANQVFKEFTAPKPITSLKFRLWKFLSGWLPRNWIKALSKILVDAQIVQFISPQYINRLSSRLITQVSKEQFQGMTVTQFNGFDAKQWKEIRFNELGDDWNKWFKLERLKQTISQLSPQERASFFASKTMENDVNFLADQTSSAAKQLMSLLIDAFVAEKKCLPAEEKSVSPETFNQQLSDKKRRENGIMLGNTMHYPIKAFADDLLRTHSEQFEINGKILANLTGEAFLHAILPDLYEAFDKNIDMLTNFEKLAHQGSMRFNAETVLKFTPFHRHLNLQSTGSWKTRVVTSATEVKIELAVHSTLSNRNSSKNFGAVDSSLEIVVKKGDLAKGDLSQAIIKHHIGALKSET